MSAARRAILKWSFLGRLLGPTNSDRRQSGSERLVWGILLAAFIWFGVYDCNHPCPDCPMIYDIDLGPDR